MSREPLRGEDPYPPCALCGRGRLDKDPDDYQIATIRWYDAIYANGTVALCDECCFAHCVRMLRDVCAGRKKSVGDVVDELLKVIAQTARARALHDDPFLGRSATDAEIEDERRKRLRIGARYEKAKGQVARPARSRTAGTTGLPPDAGSGRRP